MTGDYSILYLEINLASVLLIGIILYKTHGLTQMVAQRNFAMAIYAEMIFFLSDTVSVMMQRGLLPFSSTGVMILKTIYFFFTAVMCFFWFLYFEYMQGSVFVGNRRRVYLSTVLIWATAALLIVNFFTGWLFYVNQDGVYRRGSLFFLLYLLPYCYVFFTCGKAFFGLLFNKSTADRGLLISLAMFPLAPAVAGLLQFRYPWLPIACVALSLATLVLYLNWLDQMISLDPLTKLNNRKQLVYSHAQWTHTPSETPLYLLLIDANRFKGINDTYGHVQGDAALVRIADALRLGCRGMKRRANIARYGGDEFVILAEAEEQTEITSLCDRIRQELEKLNIQAAAPYELTVSIGIGRAKSGQSLKDLIAEADRALYEEKERVHSRQ